MLLTFCVCVLALVSPAPVLAQSNTPAFTIDAPPDLEPAAERIRGVNIARLTEALTSAGLSMPERVLITLVADADPRAASIPDWIVGLALGAENIVIFPDRVVSYPYDSLESVVRHEVAHLALTTRAGGQRMPRWFHEGVATSVDAGWSVAAQVRLLAALVGHPDTTQLRRLFAADGEGVTQQAYLLSAVFVEDLRRRHGAALPGRVAAHVARGIGFDAAFRLETGETPDAAAARAWASYRRWIAWIPAITSASAMWAVIIVLAFAAYAVQVRRRLQRRRRWDDENDALDAP